MVLDDDGAANGTNCGGGSVLLIREIHRRAQGEARARAARNRKRGRG